MVLYNDDVILRNEEFMPVGVADIEVDSVDSLRKCQGS